MDDFFENLAHELRSIVDEPILKSLVYAEVETGAISVSIFLQFENKAGVYYQASPDSITDMIYKFWELGDSDISAQSWQSLTYVFVFEVEDFQIEFVYPDQLSADESVVERRPRVVAQHFPGLKVFFPNKN